MQEFEIGKEEGLVPPDGAAEGAAVDVLDELRAGATDRFGCGGVGLQERRLIELEQVAVEVVGSRPGDHQDLGAGVTAKLRGRV